MPGYLERISVEANVCHGQPCVKGTRIMVWLILQYLANGDTLEDIFAAYPDLTAEDIRACLAYAAESARERVLPMTCYFLIASEAKQSLFAKRVALPAESNCRAPRGLTPRN